MSEILFIIICLYAVLIGVFAIASWQLPNYTPKSQTVHAGLSIIIPFRNEVHNLPLLLQAIAQLNYPKDYFEVILINDDSQDKSVLLVQKFIQSYPDLQITCLNSIRISGSPKKDALNLGVQHAKHEWIITTDADCTFLASWLETINSFIQEKHPKMIAGPVAITTKQASSFIQNFEQLDTLSLMGATLGGFGINSPFMCNGAHLIYEKSAFIAQGGFSNNTHIASGDDQFLLEKFVKAYPKQIHYLKSSQAIVSTQPQQSWGGLIAQRVRWASKTAAYTLWFAKMIGIIVLLANLITTVLLILIPILYFSDGFQNTSTRFLETLSLYTLFFKWSIDFVLIAQTSRFFDRVNYLRWYPIIMVCYPFANTYIAIKSLFSPYEWKGRRFSK